jgi:flagellar protein FlgJ
MIRVDSAFSPVAPIPPTPATAGVQAGGIGFGAAYARLRADIAGSVHNGFAPSSSAQVPVLLAGGIAAPAPAVGTRGADEGQRRDFLKRIAPWAQQVAARLGISSELVAAHAALESGWGQRVIANDGGSGYNLFGIKAGANWHGASSDATTHEYLGGAMQQMVQRFRAYDDQASAFSDYVDVLQSPRYAGLRDVGNDASAFARALVHGGYATDPAYAQKLLQVVGTVRGIATR